MVLPESALSSIVVAITVKSEEEPWDINGERRTTDDGALVLSHGDLSNIRGSELRSAFAQYHELYGDAIEERDLEAVVFAGDDVHLDVDGGFENISFSQHLGHVCIRVEQYASWPENDDRLGIEDMLRQTIDPFLHFRGAQLVSANADGSFVPADIVELVIVVLPADSNATLHELYDFGVEIDRLVAAYVGRAPSRDTLADLIRGGHANLLIGQPEGSWLDVKKAEYMLDSPRGKFSLAVEVAAFCNAEVGGVLVFGAATEIAVRGGGEVVVAVEGLDRVRATPRQYMDVLSSWVYPFPLGLRVEEVLLPNGSPVLMVDIPTQPEELKPFLVSGAPKVDDAAKIDRESITVAQRRGEDTARLTASMLQAQLAAGRAYLRGSAPRGK
jgi:hypothetical protein